MTLEMELKRRDRISEQKGREKEKKETILTMAAMHMPAEVIAQATRSTPEFVRSVLSQNT